MTYPMLDMVTFEGKMYFGHLKGLVEDQFWHPKPKNGQFSVFPHTSSACWHGYITVFRAVEGEQFVPSWLLTFTPVEEAPVLNYGTDFALQPQPVPEEIHGCPIPTDAFSYDHFESAYDLAPMKPNCGFWEVGLILWREREKHLLEIGSIGGYHNRVIGMRKLAPV